MKRMIQFTLTFILLVLPVLGNAEDNRRDSVFFLQDVGLGQFVDGGGWKTTITLVNIADKAVDFQLFFVSDGGSGLTTSFVGITGSGTSLRSSIPFQGSFTVETPGTAQQLSQGWVFLQLTDSTSRIAGEAVFRRSIAGSPDVEAVVPFDTVGDKRQVMPFDNTSGYLTGLGVANPSTSASMTVNFSFRDASGVQFFQDSVTLAPANHTAFLFSQKWSQTANKRGTVEVTSTTTDTTSGALIIGLRGSPSGALTTVLPMISPNW